ncbi:MAG: Zn-dependent hydrolase [Gemmatimonadota bacterium]
MTTTKDLLTRLGALSLVLASACSMRTEAPKSSAAERLARYTTVSIAPDLSGLAENDRKMIPHLIEAAKAMDEAFWIQAFGDKAQLMASIEDSSARALAEVNYGPWDRLDAYAGFARYHLPRSQGANYYPYGMTKEEFEAEVAGGGKRADSLKSLYTMIRRDAAGKLEAIPFSRFFAPQHERAAKALEAAAALSTDAGFKRYLTLRAKALRDDDYQPSDFAWMDMKTNPVDVVIGPIETYEDELFGYKAAHETVVLLKDKEWSGRLSRYAGLLPALQKGIPVPAEYKKETPGSNSDLNAYDVIYVSGQANTGAKTIAINLPNDEEVQLKKGARRLQLKNAMRFKFDRILVPIAKELIADDQLVNVTFDAFFENVMFHEVAHGLGIKNTINGKGTVRTALKERYSASEEGKADILGLYMIRQLRDRGELKGGRMEDNHVAFLASIFRSVRFGSGDSHGRANIAALNFLEERGAFTRDSASGKYRVDFVKMQDAANALSQAILKFQGDGDYSGLGEFNTKYGSLSSQLQSDLARLGAKGIPVDIVYIQ